MDKTEKKIRDYFLSETLLRHQFAEYHAGEARKTQHKTTRAHHEDQAWLHGVYMPAVLSGIEKDLIERLRGGT